jgi:hypothetical protein
MRFVRRREKLMSCRRLALYAFSCMLMGMYVVLAASSARPTIAAGFTQEIIADLQDVQMRGYDAFGVVATYSQDGRDFIGIAATAIASADGYNNWVFFYDGTTYLGTDTAMPSPGLQLVGSGGSGSINVQYVNYGPNDPLCCPSGRPVVIAYQYFGGHVQPNGTPPGH